MALDYLIAPIEITEEEQERLTECKDILLFSVVEWDGKRFRTRPITLKVKD